MAVALVLPCAFALAACGPSPEDIAEEPILRDLPPGSTVLDTSELQGSFMNGDRPVYSVLFASPLSARQLIAYYVDEYGFRPTRYTDGTFRETPWREGALRVDIRTRRWPNSRGTVYGERRPVPDGTRVIGLLSGTYIPPE